MTECQVQIKNHMLPRKLSGDDQNPEGTIPNVNKIRYANGRVYSAEGDKDCHGALKTNTR
jgi:hypothetical protein